MKVFLTGTAGFVGAHVLKALLEKGHEVTGLIPSGESRWRVQEMEGRFALLEARLDDLDSIRQYLNDFSPDACVHLAWYTEPGKYLSSTKNLSCLIDTISLTQELIRSGCRRMVMAGTCFEYDTDQGHMTEDSPTRPTTLYAATKLSCCYLTQQLATMAKINLAWGRIFYPFGPLEDERRLVPAAILALKKGKPFRVTQGWQLRDYIYVADVAEAFCTLIEREANGIFNISSGDAVSIRQILKMIGDSVGGFDLIQFGAQAERESEPSLIRGDNRRLKALGWNLSHSLEEGLSKTIAWWESRISQEAS